MLTRKQIGQRIKYYRTEREWNETELGERVGLSAATISRYEQGKINFSVDTLLKLGQALDVSMWNLIGDEGMEFPPRDMTPAAQHLLKATRNLNEQALQYLAAFLMMLRNE